MRALVFLIVIVACGLSRLTHAQPGTQVPLPSQTAQPLPSPPVDAESKGQAERYFLAGVSLQKTEDFEAAIAAYETSIRLYPTKSALFNLANCQRAQHRYADAWSSLHRLQTQFGTELVEPMLSTSKAQMDELENLTALLTITSHPAGATVEIDGKQHDTTPWQTPVRLTIGKHAVHVSLVGHSPRSTTVDLDPRQSLVVALELPAAPPAELAPVPEVAPLTSNTEANSPPSPKTTTPEGVHDYPDRGSVWPTVGWASLAVGAVGVAIGANVGLRALDVNARLADVCETSHCGIGQAPQIDRLERLTTTANIWMGAGAMLLVTGATLVLWPASERDEDVSVNVNPAGLFVEGCF